MRNDFAGIAGPQEEDLRNVRLARGLRAVAAAVIIGGIAVIMADSIEPAAGDPSGQAMQFAMEPFAIPLPELTPDAALPLPAAPRAPREADASLGRLDHAVDQHG